MDTYETDATHNLAETCCASISLDQLQELSEEKGIPLLSHSTKMTYGEIAGLKELRVNLARLYSSRVGNYTTYMIYHGLSLIRESRTYHVGEQHSNYPGRHHGKSSHLLCSGGTG
jgi:hypothetical protein